MLVCRMPNCVGNCSWLLRTEGVKREVMRPAVLTSVPALWCEFYFCEHIDGFYFNMLAGKGQKMNTDNRKNLILSKQFQEF